MFWVYVNRKGLTDRNLAATVKHPGHIGLIGQLHLIAVTQVLHALHRQFVLGAAGRRVHRHGLGPEQALGTQALGSEKLFHERTHAPAQPGRHGDLEAALVAVQDLGRQHVGEGLLEQVFALETVQLVPDGQAGHIFGLLMRQHTGMETADTGKTCRLAGRSLIVTRQHHHLDPPAAQLRHGTGRPGFHAVGDGKHGHPTQALLDLYTIWQRFGHLDGLKVGIVGDISHSRVCGSLIPALKIVGAEVTLIAPGTLIPMNPEILGADRVSASLDDVLPELDVVYMLRIQRERLEGAPFPSQREYHMLYGLTEARERLMKPEAIVCHPGPINRGVELDSYMADHPQRSVILDQVYAGICVRMAALYLLLGGADNGLAS